MSFSKLGIIGAMKEEIELLFNHMTETATYEKAGITYTEGKFHGKSVVVCKSGVGKVNAAVCTQVLIDRFQVDCVIFTGVAGAVDPKLNIGDIVISQDCLQHDMDVTALGFKPGEIPFQANSTFVADKRLRELALKASRSLFPDNSFEGRVLSGDQFIADRERVAWLYRELNGTCTEMEGAAVAQTCDMNGVPFVVIRSMSDKADGSAHVNFAEFTIQASNHSYQIVENMVQQLAEVSKL